METKALVMGISCALILHGLPFPAWAFIHWLSSFIHSPGPVSYAPGVVIYSPCIIVYSPGIIVYLPSTDDVNVSSFVHWVSTLCRPAHAMYFSTYETAKHLMHVDRNTVSPFATATAGAAATIVNEAVMTPGDVVKQRLQMAHSPYKGIIDCVQKTLQTEGIGAFFRSYQTTVCTTGSFSAEISVRPPHKLFNFILSQNMFWIRVSKKLYLILKKEALQTEGIDVFYCSYQTTVCAFQCCCFSRNIA